MLEQLLSGAKDSILKELTGRLGLNPDQAGGFLQKGLALLEGAFKGGKLDLASLTSGTPSTVASKLDTTPLAGLVGGDPGKARVGLESILGPLMSSIKNNAGGAQQILGHLTGEGGKTGLMGQVTEFAGKLMGKA